MVSERERERLARTAESESDGPGTTSAGWWKTLFISIFLLGAVLRLTNLGARPLHGDEAVGAVCSRMVMQTGVHLYSSANRHGPFQYYLGGGAMALCGPSDAAIRLPFAIIGSLLPLALLPFRRPMGNAGLLVSAGLVAVSPTFVYFSRHAIQEILFVFATALWLACGYLFARSGSARSLVGLIFAAAWMVTLKETFIIAWGCLFIAFGAGLLIAGSPFRQSVKRCMGLLIDRLPVLFGGSVVALLLVALAYTDCFRQPVGLYNLGRNLVEMVGAGATSEATRDLHRQAATYYLDLLIRYEWSTLLLALVGFAVVFRSRRPWMVVVALYALSVTAVHVALPYKNPWLLLTPLLPLTLMAGIGGARICRRFQVSHPRRPVPVTAIIAVLLVCLAPLPKTIVLNFLRSADPAEPMVYHQAGLDQLRLARDLRQLAAKLPADLNPKALIALPYAWPLVWYLRDRQDFLYVPDTSPDLEQAVQVPLVVTLEAADPRFLQAFTGKSHIRPFSPPGYRSQTYVMVPPDYTVARLWIDPALGPVRSE